MFRVCSLMAEQIAIRSCIVIALITFPALFADGQGNGTVRILLFYGRYQSAYFLICEERIFTALQHKGSKPQCVSRLTTIQDFFLCQPVAIHFWVAVPDTAIVAVIFAVVRKFDQAPDKDLIAVNPAGSFLCCFSQIFFRMGIFRFEKHLKLPLCYVFANSDGINDVLFFFRHFPSLSEAPLAHLCPETNISCSVV